MRDLRNVATEVLHTWIADLRAQLNLAVTAINSPSGGAQYSPAEARKLIQEYNDELDRRETGVRERSIIRSWMVDPVGYY